MELKREILNEDATAGNMPITIEGKATIGSVSELKTALLEALGSTGHVVLDVSRVTATDCAFFQLLCSAHRTSALLRKRLTLGAVRSEAFSRGAKDAGFHSANGCGENMHSDCLWMGGHDR